MVNRNYVSRNSFEISGRLTSDAALYDGKNGKVARFDIAHNFGKDQAPLFPKIVMFPKNGKKDVTIPTDLLKKGTAVIVSGYMRPASYTNAEGKTIRSIEFVALGVEAINADPADEQAAEQAPAEEQAPQAKKSTKKSK